MIAEASSYQRRGFSFGPLSVVRCPLLRNFWFAFTTDNGQLTTDNAEHPMSYVLGLKCKECGHRTGIKPLHVCEACFGPYEVEYDYAKMKGKATRGCISRG